MKKIKLVLSDFHLGAGALESDGTPSLLEDFFSDRKFIEFLHFYSNGDYRRADVELIINGDFINALQIEVDGKFPDGLTEDICLTKAKSCVEGHPQLFAELRRFSQLDNHRVVMIMGNHDPFILWPRVRDLFAEVIGAKTQFYIDGYEFDGIRVEHGHQFEMITYFDPNRYFVKGLRKEPILNLPWGCYFVINVMTRVKQSRPHVDKIFPFRVYLLWALVTDVRFAIRLITTFLGYFLVAKFTTRPFRSGIRNSLRMVGRTSIFPKMHRYAKFLLDENLHLHTIILGHSHHIDYRRFPDKKQYINTGTWLKNTSLEVTDLGTQQKFTYALIDYPEGGRLFGKRVDQQRPVTMLKQWKGEHRVIEDVF